MSVRQIALKFSKSDPLGMKCPFSQCIWRKVRKSGLKQYYSTKSSEPKFGSFVRMTLGLPFLQISDLDQGYCFMSF